MSGQGGEGADPTDGWQVDAPQALRGRRIAVTPHVAAVGQTPRAPVPRELVDFLPLAQSGRRSYAVIDAALVPNLPELLEASGLPHRCLYRIETQPELAHSAPWLVALTQDCRFLRGIFTAGDRPDQLWNSHAVMLLASDSDLDALHRLLRRFTRVQDSEGRWYYWRFWEPRALLAFLAEADFSPMARQFLSALSDLSGQTMIILPGQDGASLFELQARDSESCAPTPGTVQLSDTDRRIFREELRRRDADQLGGFLATLPVLGRESPDYLRELALRALIRRDQLDIRSPNGIAWTVILLFMSDRHPKAAALTSKLVSSRRWSFDQIARMLNSGAQRQARKEAGADRKDG